MKKTVTILIIVCLLFALSACGSGSSKTESTASYTDNPKAEITVRDYGTITLELYPDVAPLTVDNFVKLCNEGFYDGLTFHRVMSGFWCFTPYPLPSCAETFILSPGKTPIFPKRCGRSASYFPNWSPEI